MYMGHMPGRDVKACEFSQLVETVRRCCYSDRHHQLQCFAMDIIECQFDKWDGWRSGVEHGRICTFKLIPMCWSAPCMVATAISVLMYTWIIVSRFGQYIYINTYGLYIYIYIYIYIYTHTVIIVADLHIVEEWTIGHDRSLCSLSALVVQFVSFFSSWWLI